MAERAVAPRGRVLLVDDSVVVRSVLGEFLRGAGFAVSAARHPPEALQYLEEAFPDVLLLDVEMPHMDGLTFLRRLRDGAYGSRAARLPVVMFSASTARGSRNAITALSLGAAEVVCKPREGLREFLDEAGPPLRRALGSLVGGNARPPPAAPRPDPDLRPGPPLPCPPSAGPDPEPAAAPVLRIPCVDADRLPPDVLATPQVQLWRRLHKLPLLALGSSTGGLQALETLLAELPEDTAPVLVAQHLPEAFMGAFAERLDGLVRPTVRVAQDGREIGFGEVWIAPGNRQLGARTRGDRIVLQVQDAPPVNRHRPSVDHLFAALAGIREHPLMAALLTGMGADGARGLARLRIQGATTFAQRRETCVVAGMPGSALRLDAADHEATLQTIGRAMARLGESRLR